jgi:hypothetical protein
MVSILRKGEPMGEIADPPKTVTIPTLEELVKRKLKAKYDKLSRADKQTLAEMSRCQQTSIPERKDNV